MIAIIDYDAGNLKSVEKALVFLGEKPVVTRDPKEILRAAPCDSSRSRVFWRRHGKFNEI